MATATLPTDQWEDESSSEQGPAASAKARKLLSGADAEADQAYAAGRDGLPALDDWDDALRQAWQAGVDDAANDKGPSLGPDQGAKAALSSLKPAKASKPTEGVARFLIGAVLAANIMAFVNYGASGVRSWWAAKFWNSPSLGSSSSSPAGGGTTPSMGEQENPAKPVIA